MELYEKPKAAVTPFTEEEQELVLAGVSAPPEVPEEGEFIPAGKGMLQL